jgi:hypothetical protein
LHTNVTFNTINLSTIHTNLSIFLYSKLQDSHATKDGKSKEAEKAKELG